MEYLTAYEPSWRDRLANTMLGDDPSYVRKRFVEGLLGSRGMGPTGMGVVDATPIGGLLAAQEAAQGGDYRGAAMAVMPMGGVLNREAKALGREVQTGIRAYHGSPHDFDRFDLSKIGTGEGAQAYGHGLYFAEAEPTAREYRDQLSGGPKRFVGEEPYRSNDPVHLAASLRKTFAPHGGDKRVLEVLQGDIDSGHLDEQSLDIYKKTMDLIKSGNQTPDFSTKPSGHMYEVSINAHPDHFLDLDKPLSEQSEHVKNLIKEHFPSALDDVRQQTGQNFYKEQVRNMMKIGTGNIRPEQFISNVLNHYGIKGNKYLDAGSRGKGDGTRNYVVFDDSLIEILRKYGIVGLLGAGAGYNVMAPTDASAATR